MSNQEGSTIKKDTLFDLSGFRTELPMTKARTITVLLAIAVFVLVTLIGPAIGLESTQAGMALGLVIATIILWVSNQFSLIIGGLLISVGGLVLKLVTVPQVQQAFGSSSFLVMLGMFIVSMGATRTDLAKRIAYAFLIKFGKSPSKILLAVCLATGLVSAFCSNLATTIVMSSICIGILIELGEVKGESGLGKAMMLLIPVFSMVGGMSLISGSPGMNMVGITTLEQATGGQFTIEYGQWAAIGIPCALALIFPSWFVYKKIFNVKSVSDKEIPPEYFKEKLAGLGPISGSEIRWIITVLFMVISMTIGVFAIQIASLLCGLITIFPVIGTVSHKDAMKSLPLDVLLMQGFCPIIAVIFENYGIGRWLTGGFAEKLEGMPVYLLMLTFGLLLAVMNNIFANATAGIIALCVAAFTPLVISMGLNPSIILLPAIFMGACSVFLGVNTNLVLTYNYGYWNMKDPLLPGGIIVILWVLIITTVAYFVAPMAGMSFYI